MTTMTATKPTPTPPTPFIKPGPGSWTLDAAHCERPLPRFVRDVFATSFTRGFREGLTAYGALLESVEAASVNGFLYTCVRPVGAPPEPKGTPPKAVFKLLTTLHPEFRKRTKRADDAMRNRLWRAEMTKYVEEWAPPVDRRRAELLSVQLDRLDDGALVAHIEKCFAHVDEAFTLHHRMNCTRVVPVGDFLAHLRTWTDVSTLDALRALRGCSPDSREGLHEMSKLADLIRSDDAARALVASDAPAEEILIALETRTDAVGNAARAWIATVGHNVTGFSPGYPTLRESPATLIEGLRGTIAGDDASDSTAAGSEALAQLRARVPAEHRAAFDALFEEAKSVYYMRDHACMKTTATCGIARLAFLEAGRRLVSRGRLVEPEAALEATVDEIRSLLLNGSGPSAETLQRFLEWRRSATADAAPELLGAAPAPPPPDDWLPKGAVRLQRAVGVYLQAMFGEADENQSSSVLVRGLSASGGKRIGTARLVLEPGDFDRIRSGDILVARITSPSYNILLPLLAGIVTDRGGVLSHPAIVSREYGIPGVVGTRTATKLIPDGARVEIDGDAGTVRVLS